ncbi:hypothetical protein HC251_09720 [Iamia sp. SCSIO 61187]|uniref:hypothetical protein n=1 Tax=Iamia sp. SCSIO 61187 TaxID=2722752 RepID=UPI001C626251|nr:hypothetical protein [Iamia sp. SCSIO 61187]QYG92682.1 hypothetical protein HC251_09720 [Iamia sp. SCSIO 61187]
MIAPGPPVVRPRGWWYLVPVALALLAVVGGIVAVQRGFRDAEQTARDASAAAPGTDQPLTIPEPASYTVAYFGPIIVRSTQDQARLAEDLQLRIVPADGGAPLELRPYDGLNDLTEDGEQYVPLLTVRFDTAGEYVLRSSATSGIDPERAGVVVSESPYRKLRSGAERGVVLLVVGIFLAVLVAVILGRTRGRSRAAIRASAPPPAPWPPPGPWGPAGWPPAR